MDDNFAPEQKIDSTQFDFTQIDSNQIYPTQVVVEIASPGQWQWQEVRPVQRKRKWKLPLILFILTCLSTLLVSTPINKGWDGIFYGLRYAVPIMIILICHEMGHFIQAWRYGVYSSFPYFLPMPLSPIGTFGAVITMEPRMGHRRALFDIGITGPLAGLVPTIIFTIIGLHHSSIKPLTTIIQQSNTIYGDPLLIQWLTHWILGNVPPNCDVLIDPMAFAGWVGMLITSLNLMPIGQLDGGHILYALLKQKANRVATLLLMAMVCIVAWNYDTLGGWLLMLFLLIIMGPKHPPTANDAEPLGWFRIILGWLTLAFIFIGFTPTPILSMSN
jgi:membrane-associated protease RseP (regulator of RpoE activity)